MTQIITAVGGGAPYGAQASFRWQAGGAASVHYPDLDPALGLWPVRLFDLPASAVVGPSLFGGPVAQELLAVAGSALAMARSVGLVRAVGSSGVGSIVRSIGYALAGGSGSVVSLAAGLLFQKALSAAAGSALGLVKSVGLVRSAASSASASFVRSIGVVRSATAGSSRALARGVGKTLSRAAVGSGVVQTSFLPGVVAEAARVFLAVARAVLALVQPRGASGTLTVFAVARTTAAAVSARNLIGLAPTRPLTFVAVAP